MPSSIGYQFDSTRPEIDGEALQQFSECFHFSCTARKASPYPDGTDSVTRASACRNSSLVCVISVSSGSSSSMEITRLSIPRRSNSPASCRRCSSSRPPGVFQRCVCDSIYGNNSASDLNSMKAWSANVTGRPFFTIVVEGVTSDCRETASAHSNGLTLTNVIAIHNMNRTTTRILLTRPSTITSTAYYEQLSNSQSKRET